MTARLDGRRRSRPHKALQKTVVRTDRKGRNGTFPTVSLSYRFRGPRQSPHRNACPASTLEPVCVGNRFGSIDLLPAPCTEKRLCMYATPGIAGMASRRAWFVSAGRRRLPHRVSRVRGSRGRRAAPDEEEEEEDPGLPVHPDEDAHLVESRGFDSEDRGHCHNDAKALHALEDQDGEDPHCRGRDAVVWPRASACRPRR